MELRELLKLERHIEGVIVGAMEGACEFIYYSRMAEISNSPRIVVKSIVGSVFQNQKLPITTAPGWIYSAYEGQIVLDVVTNRTLEEDTGAHYTLLGEVRARMQQHALLAWQDEQENSVFPVLIFDIREDSTSDDADDTENLDTTTLTYNVLFSINPTSIPEDI